MNNNFVNIAGQIEKQEHGSPSSNKAVCNYNLVRVESIVGARSEDSDSANNINEIIHHEPTEIRPNVRARGEHSEEEQKKEEEQSHKVIQIQATTSSRRKTDLSREVNQQSKEKMEDMPRENENEEKVRASQRRESVVPSDVQPFSRPNSIQEILDSLKYDIIDENIYKTEIVSFTKELIKMENMKILEKSNGDLKSCESHFILRFDPGEVYKFYSNSNFNLREEINKRNSNSNSERSNNNNINNINNNNNATSATSKKSIAKLRRKRNANELDQCDKVLSQSTNSQSVQLRENKKIKKVHSEEDIEAHQEKGGISTSDLGIIEEAEENNNFSLVRRHKEVKNETHLNENRNDQDQSNPQENLQVSTSTDKQENLFKRKSENPFLCFYSSNPKPVNLFNTSTTNDIINNNSNNNQVNSNVPSVSTMTNPNNSITLSSNPFFPKLNNPVVPYRTNFPTQHDSINSFSNVQPNNNQTYSNNNVSNRNSSFATNCHKYMNILQRTGNNINPNSNSNILGNVNNQGRPNNSISISFDPFGQSSYIRTAPPDNNNNLNIPFNSNNNSGVYNLTDYRLPNNVINGFAGVGYNSGNSANHLVNQFGRVGVVNPSTNNSGSVAPPSTNYTGGFSIAFNNSQFRNNIQPNNNIPFNNNSIQPNNNNTNNSSNYRLYPHSQDNFNQNDPNNRK